jgi:hypothetical protein
VTDEASNVIRFPVEPEHSFAEFSPLTARAVKEALRQARAEYPDLETMNPYRFSQKLAMNLGVCIEQEVRDLRRRVREMEGYFAVIGRLLGPMSALRPELNDIAD